MSLFNGFFAGYEQCKMNKMNNRRIRLDSNEQVEWQSVAICCLKLRQNNAL